MSFGDFRNLNDEWKTIVDCIQYLEPRCDLYVNDEGFIIINTRVKYASDGITIIDPDDVE